MTRECVQLNNHVQIQRVVKLLGTDFAASHNPNMRKGALVGLAAVAIALGTGVTTNTILPSSLPMTVSLFLCGYEVKSISMMVTSLHSVFFIRKPQIGSASVCSVNDSNVFLIFIILEFEPLFF